MNARARTVAEVMTTPHWLLVRNDTDPVADILAMMDQYSLASVPIVGSANRSWRGLVLMRELAELRERDPALERTSAAELAHRELSLSPADSLHLALDRMREHELGRLPVVDGDTLVGSITRSAARSHIGETAEADRREWRPATFTGKIRGAEGMPAFDRWEAVARAERSRGYGLALAAAHSRVLRRALGVPPEILQGSAATL